MDTSALFTALLDTFLNFWLQLFLDSLFSILGDLLFGGPPPGLV